jgi:hypothetical protein
MSPWEAFSSGASATNRRCQTDSKTERLQHLDHSRRMWSKLADCSLFTNNVVSFAHNPVETTGIIAINLVPNSPMIAVRGPDDCSSLQLGDGHKVLQQAVNQPTISETK